MMKLRKYLFILSFLLASQALFAQVSLCNSIFQKLKEKKLSPGTQSLIISGDNSFPYNIILDYPAASLQSEEGKNPPNLFLCFYQEDIAEKPELAVKLAEYIQNAKLPVNVSIIFAYGERQKIEKEGMIYGSDVFINSLNSNEDNTVIICNLAARKEKILTSSRKKIAPSYLIKIAYSSFLHSSLNKAIPNYYVSQLYSYNFFYDRNLSSLFENDIPGIKLEYTRGTEQSLIEESLKNIIKGFSSAVNRTWDHHFLLIKVFNRFLRLKETTTIKMVIVIFLIWLIFIFMLIFINIRQKRTTWNAIKNVWYTIPVTFLLITISFYLGKLLFNLFLSTGSDAKTIVYICSCQMLISFFVCAAYYTIILLINPKFGEKSIDYLIIFSCFANQSIFILIDISLFPIFMIICFLSIIAFVIKNNPLHITVFFLMILIFVPYLVSLISNANIQDLRLYLITNNALPFYMAILLTPLFLIYFRILTSISRNSKKSLTFFITHSSFFILVLILLPIVSSFIIKDIEKNNIKDKLLFEKAEENQAITIHYTDKKIFDDIIRKISINIDGQPIQCDVRLYSALYQPLLYTDNDYTILSYNSGYFNIPSYPPQEMTFSYGTDNRPTNLTVTVFFETDKENVYSVVSKSISLGAPQ